MALAVAHLARPLLGLTVAVFTFGACMKVDLAGLRAEVARWQLNCAILVWSAFAVPWLMFAVITLAGVQGGWAQGLMLWSLAPPAGAAGALAAILGLNAPMALLTTVLATAAAPFYMPVMASALGGVAISVDPSTFFIRLAAMVGGAFLASLLLKTAAPSFVRRNPDAMTGIAVVALFVNGIAAMDGMQAKFLAAPQSVVLVLAVAYAANLGSQCLGGLVWWWAGRREALTTGPLSGNRNVSLSWAAVGHGLEPIAEVIFAASVVAIHTSPAMTRRVIARLMRGSARSRHDGQSGATAMPPTLIPVVMVSRPDPSKRMG